MPTTPNMSMLLPIPTITPGPTYASENNDAFEVVDQHDHTTGKGLPVPSNGININNDLPFNGFNASSLRSTQFQSQASPLSLPGDITCLYVSNGNLYYNNQIGQQVRITSGAALDASTIGGIGGDYVGSGALEFYTSFDRTFTFWSATNVPANLDAGSITIRPVALSPFGITINAPLSLAADYQMTLPGSNPSTESFLTVDAAGVIRNDIAINSLGIAGTITMYGGIVAPTGYLLCDGSAISRTTYAPLFVAIGTNYGVGDGSTTFNIPDLRGIFPRGVNAGSGNDPNAGSRTATNGGNAGDNVGSFQTNATAKNGLSLSDPGHLHSITTFSAGSPGIGTSATATTLTAATAATNSAVTGITLSTGDAETRPINVYVNFIIKT